MTASEARAKTELAKQKNREKILALIESNSDGGHDFMTIYTTISAEFIAELIGLGYTVVNNNNLLTISW